MADFYSFSHGKLESYTEHKDYLELKVLIAYPIGLISSSNGKKFKFDNDSIQIIHDNYNGNVFNGLLRTLRLKHGPNVVINDDDLDTVETQPVQKDHSLKIDDTIGRMVGKLRIENVEGEFHLLANIRVKDPLYINKIKSNLIRDFSLTVDDRLILREISAVAVPALPDARSFDGGSIGNNTVSIEEATENVIYDKIDNNKNNPNKITELIKELKNLHQEKEIMEGERNKLLNNQEIENKLNKLVKDGIIVRRDKKPIKERLKKFSVHGDKLEALELMSLGDKVINDKVPYNFNFGVSLEEIVNMTQKIDRANLTPEQLGQEIRDRMEGKYQESKSFAAPHPDTCISKNSTFGEHELNKLHDMYKSGNHKDFADYVAEHLKFTDKKEDGDDNKEFSINSEELTKFNARIDIIENNITNINKTLMSLAGLEGDNHVSK